MCSAKRLRAKRTMSPMRIHSSNQVPGQLLLSSSRGVNCVCLCVAAVHCRLPANREKCRVSFQAAGNRFTDTSHIVADRCPGCVESRKLSVCSSPTSSLQLKFGYNMATWHNCRLEPVSQHSGYKARVQCALGPCL